MYGERHRRSPSFLYLLRRLLVLLYYLKSLEFKNNGILIQKYMDEVWKEKLTKGLVICLHRTTASPYFIQTIDGVEYLFMEWRMGNYIYGGCEPTYYVFRR